MGLEEHFTPAGAGIKQSCEFTEYGMRRLIIGEPRIIKPYDYTILAPKLEGMHAVGDGFCDVRTRTVTDAYGEDVGTLQIGYIAVDPLLRGKGISKRLTDFVLAEARELGLDISFLYPAGCESMVEKIALHEIGAGIFPMELNDEEFGLLVTLKRRQDGMQYSEAMPVVARYAAQEF